MNYVRRRQLEFAALVSAPLIWWVVVLLVPYVIMLMISFYRTQFPFHVPDFQVANYLKIFAESQYVTILLRSLKISIFVSIVTFALAYPLTYFLVFKLRSPRLRTIIYVATIVPLWVSYLLRVYTWKIVLGTEGILNTFLIWIGVVDEPIGVLLYNQYAMVITMAYIFTPFMVMPLFATLEKIPRSLIEGSKDLGVGSLGTFLRITLPLSVPGILVGFTFTFCFSFGDFISPRLVGGPYSQHDLQRDLDAVWPGHGLALRLGALHDHALHCAGGDHGVGPVRARRPVGPGLAVATLDRDLPNGAALERPRRRRRSDRDLSYRALAIVTGCVLAFLYVPIATLMIFSFNDNKVMRLPFGDWTLQWYVKAFTNPQLLAAVGNSLIVAVCALAICLVIGIPTALALSRYDFPGKTVFRRLVILPITLPGIITGVSMLSFFSQLGIELSLTTVIIGHGTAFAAIVITSVYARLERFDRRIIEASADLGVTPLRTFWKVTLPNIRTSIIGSSLLVFTLSFDEIPVTFFLTGRDNTLPMYIWSAIRRGITPEINAIGTVIIAVSIILIVASTAILIQPAERRRER